MKSSMPLIVTKESARFDFQLACIEKNLQLKTKYFVSNWSEFELLIGNLELLTAAEIHVAQTELINS